MRVVRHADGDLVRNRISVPRARWATGGLGRVAPLQPLRIVQDSVGVRDAERFEEDDQVVIGVGGAQALVTAPAVNRDPPAARHRGTMDGCPFAGDRAELPVVDDTELELLVRLRAPVQLFAEHSHGQSPRRSCRAREPNRPGTHQRRPAGPWPGSRSGCPPSVSWQEEELPLHDRHAVRCRAPDSSSAVVRYFADAPTPPSATCAGVPLATTVPPSSPAPGPRSMT